jgi:hypothetical protein
MAQKLHVVNTERTTAKPVRKLGRHGLDLWRSIMSEYAIVDSGGVEMLMQACEGADRLQEITESIARDGVMLRTKTGLKENPLLKAEIALRSFVCRTLARLGLDVEPLRSGPGRPPGYA